MYVTVAFLHASVAESVDAAGLNPVHYGFESHFSHQIALMAEWHTRQIQNLFSLGSSPSRGTSCSLVWFIINF
jgi:hypothetical protein